LTPLEYVDNAAATDNFQPATLLNYKNTESRHKVNQTARLLLSFTALFVFALCVQDTSAQNSRFDVSGVVVDTSGVGIPSSALPTS